MGLLNSQKTEEKYITLKEASAISGYSSDYIGQLIRKGKLNGKRVYANPVWMTTEKDLLDYLESNVSNGSSKEKTGKKISNFFRSWKTRLRSEVELLKLYKVILYFIITVSFTLSLFVFYIFSVNFDDWLSRRSSSGQEVEFPVEEPPVESGNTINF